MHGYIKGGYKFWELSQFEPLVTAYKVSQLQFSSRLFVFLFAQVCERISIKPHSTESGCYRTGKYTVCRHVHASFSPEMLQAGAVKRLIVFWLGFWRVSAHHLDIEWALTTWTSHLPLCCKINCAKLCSCVSRSICERIQPLTSWGSQLNCQRRLVMLLYKLTSHLHKENASTDNASSQGPYRCLQVEFAK